MMRPPNNTNTNNDNDIQIGLMEHNLSECQNTLTQEFNRQAKKLLPATIRLLTLVKPPPLTVDSILLDNTNTNNNAESFALTEDGLPDVSNKHQTGGLLTSALLKVLYAEENRVALNKLSYHDILNYLTKSLDSNCSSIPLLGSSVPMDVSAPFSFLNKGELLTTAHEHDDGPVAVSEQYRKRALLIGIHYSGKKGGLKHTHNDVLNMKEFIIDHYGFLEENVKILMDYSDYESPTMGNILRECRKLVSQSVSGDTVYFHFSGHGSRYIDNNNIAANGFHENTLLPLDYQSAEQIRDEDLFLNLLCPMPSGVNLTCLIDCFHSSFGSIVDLPFEYLADGQQKQMQVNQLMNFQRLHSFCPTLIISHNHHHSSSIHLQKNSKNFQNQHQQLYTTPKEDFRDKIPSPKEALEYSELSKLIYKVKSKAFFDSNDNSGSTRKTEDISPLKCHYFYRVDIDETTRESGSGTLQAMIVSSDELRYIAVVFGVVVAGSSSSELFTNNNNDGTKATTLRSINSILANWNTNKGIVMTNPGTSDNSLFKYPWHLEDLVKVHRGFNNIYFSGDRYQKITSEMESVHRKYPDYKLVFTGHSIGAAFSLLAGVYTAEAMPDCQISVLNFACPRIGNGAFKEWVEECVENLSVWRFVYEEDIVPRLPPAFLAYRHVGHLIHLDKYEAKAYFRDLGNDDMDLVSGQPAESSSSNKKYNWNSVPTCGPVEFCSENWCFRYVNYLKNRSVKNVAKYYATSFADDKNSPKFWNILFPSNDAREIGLV